MRNKVNVLGTEYRIEIHKISEDKIMMDNSWQGYCDEDSHIIVIADMDETEYFQFSDEKWKDECAKQTLRHEIIHAFFNESGLKSSAMQYQEAWSRNEEMVDWIATQFPKIAKVFKELDIM